MSPLQNLLPSRMYDETRESLICALPTRCYKVSYHHKSVPPAGPVQVAISVGTYDLKDNSLITLKEASMEEVRRRNEPKLVAKATILRDLVRFTYNHMHTIYLHLLHLLHHICLPYR